MITSCPHCSTRYQVLKSDLFPGPMRARCPQCSMVFWLNESMSSDDKPLTLRPGALITLSEDADVSHLHEGPEWVGDDLMGPLILLSTQSPPVAPLAPTAFGMRPPSVPVMDMDAPREPPGPGLMTTLRKLFGISR